jgi:hypothetical protein
MMAVVASTIGLAIPATAKHASMYFKRVSSFGRRSETFTVQSRNAELHTARGYAASARNFDRSMLQPILYLEENCERYRICPTVMFSS